MYIIFVCVILYYFTSQEIGYGYSQEMIWTSEDVQWWTRTRTVKGQLRPQQGFSISGERLAFYPAYDEAYPPKAALPYHAAAAGFLRGPRTDAAVLGSCSRLQDRDAATELTVKRGEQFSTSAHAIRKFVKCLIKKNFFVFSFYVRYDRFVDCDILWIPRSRLRPSPRRVEGRARVSGAFSHDSQVYFQQSAAELPPRHTMTQTIRT